MTKRLLIALLVLCSMEVCAAQTITWMQPTVSGGIGLGSRGYNYTFRWDALRHELLYLGGSATDGTIYSGTIWGYNSATHAWTQRVTNGATGSSDSSVVCPSPGPDIMRNPAEGHPQGYVAYDTIRNKLIWTFPVCSGYRYNATSIYDSATATMDTQVASGPFGTGSTTNGYDDQLVIYAQSADRAVWCCSTAPYAATVAVKSYAPATQTWTDVTSSLSGVSFPFAWWGETGFYNPNDGLIYLFGGCYNGLTCTISSDVYTLNPTTWAVTKLTAAGVALSNSGLNFPSAIFDSGRNRIVYLARNGTLYAGAISGTTVTWSTLTTSGTAPTWTNDCDGGADSQCSTPTGYDPITDKMVVARFSAQSTAPTIYELAFSVPPSVPVVQSGTGAPSNSVGNDGDLYRRTDAPYQSIYGPKASGTWPAEFSYIIGKGCTTAYHIDEDCDGYGVGPTSTIITDPTPLFGDDADDADATVNTPASVLAKYGTINSFLTHLGYPINRVYYLDPAAGNNANFASYACSAAHPCQTYGAVAAALHDGAGGTVLVRASTNSSWWLSGEHCSGDASWPCYYPTANAGNLVVFMPYPGERVTFTGLSVIVGGASGTSTEQNVVWRGFHLLKATPDLTGTGNGNAATGNWLRNVTLTELECAGYDHCFEPAAGSQNITISKSLFYATTSHALYPVTADGSPQSVYSSSLLDCNAWVWSTSNYNPHFNMQIKGNVFLFAGQSGLEAVHLNAEMCGGEFSGNFVIGGGGVGLGLMTAPQNIQVYNNVFANNSSAAILLDAYGCENNGNPATQAQFDSGECDGNNWGVGTSYYPSNINANNISFNTIYTGTTSPNGISPVCQSACQAPSYGIQITTQRAQGTPDNHWVKNTTINSNIIATYTNGTTGLGNFPQLLFQVNSFPETNPITNNAMYNMAGAHGSGYVMHIAQAADCTQAHSPYWKCTGAGTWTVTSGSTETQMDWSFAQLQTYNTGLNSGNVFGSPSFVNVDSTLIAHPNRYNFRVIAGSSAASAGNSAGAPGTDITGAIRSSSPTSGAYEVSGGSLQQPPGVSITSPTNGATVSGTVSIAATCTAGSASLSGVTFYYNDNTIATDTTAPYSTSWDTTLVANASYNLTATCADINGLSGSSNTATVTVNNGTSGSSLSAALGVAVDSNTVFDVRADGLDQVLACPKCYFAGPDDLMPGQTTEIRIRPGTVPAPIADRVILRQGAVNGHVVQLQGPNFVFQPSDTALRGQNLIVTTGIATLLDGFTSTTSLQVGQTLAVRGLLIKSSPLGGPTLIAKRIKLLP